jgi:hypothetical protein
MTDHDPDVVAALAKGTGRHVTNREALELAVRLRTVTDLLPPGRGPSAGLSKRLDDAAQILEDQVAHRRRRR